MKTEDILKAFVVFIIGIILTFDICYYHPASTKDVEHIDVPVMIAWTSPVSETNSVLHIPLIRIGSGIR
tara:strand:+ start:1489 stop:1695 length:207 start_codon:yes stop_codon:yes gene_type:complete